MQFDPNYVSHLATAVAQSSAAESQLTLELSSGLRVTSLQVDPVAAAGSSRIGTAIARDDSYIQAAAGKQSILQVTDATLGEIVSQLTSAVTLAVQGSNGTMNTANTASIALQLTAIRDQMVSLANTSYAGVYLFSGSQGATKPYSIASSAAPGAAATAVYAGDDGVQTIQTPTGQSIQTNLPGKSVFGDASSGVFAALNQLIADFTGGSPASTAAADSSALTAALTGVSSQRSILGSSLSQLQSTSIYFQSDKATLTGQQAGLVSSDITTIATELKSAETQHQALLSVMAALGSSNLFNYMK
jgi:flagellar hook-associated protein 3 FlgL